MTRRVSVWPLVVAAALIGCGGKVVVDADGGTTEVDGCDRACARVVAACGNWDQATCVAMCEQNAEQSQANGCGEVNGQLVSCIADASDDVVCGPGMGVPASCQALYEELDACL